MSIRFGYVGPKESELFVCKTRFGWNELEKRKEMLKERKAKSGKVLLPFCMLFTAWCLRVFSIRKRRIDLYADGTVIADSGKL